VDNFRAASGKKPGGFVGLWFNDSGVYKWIEDASYAMAIRRSEPIVDRIKSLAEEIIETQQSNGYISTFTTINKLER